MLFRTSGDCPGSGSTSHASKGPSLVKSGPMSWSPWHITVEGNPSAASTTNTLALSVRRTLSVLVTCLISSGVGGMVGMNCSNVTELTTGVAADAGIGFGGGCSGDSVCAPSSTTTASGTGTYPGIQVNADSSGTVYPSYSIMVSKTGVAGAAYSAAFDGGGTSDSSIGEIRDGITETSNITLAKSKSKPSPRSNESAVSVGGITGRRSELVTRPVSASRPQRPFPGHPTGIRRSGLW